MELHCITAIEDLAMYITGAGWNPFMFQVVLYISTIMQGCLSPSPHKTLKPVACSALSHPFIVQAPPSPTTYKKKLVFGEQKLLLLLGGGLPRFMGYPNKIQECFKGSSVRDHQLFCCWSLKEKSIIPKTDPVAVSFCRLLKKVKGLSFYKGANG